MPDTIKLSDEKLWKMINYFSPIWIKKFVFTLKNLLLENQFDLVVGGGNSSLAMFEIAKIVCKDLDFEYPAEIAFPIFRYIPNQDQTNSDIKFTKMVAVADDQGFESKIDKFDSKVDFMQYV